MLVERWKVKTIIIIVIETNLTWKWSRCKLDPLQKKAAIIPCFLLVTVSFLDPVFLSVGSIPTPLLCQLLIQLSSGSLCSLTSQVSLVWPRCMHAFYRCTFVLQMAFEGRWAKWKGSLLKCHQRRRILLKPSLNSSTYFNPNFFSIRSLNL